MNQDCKIAVLDSGIDCLTEDKNVEIIGECYDDNGHGTMCYQTIRRLAPNSLFGIYKILDRSLVTSSAKLVELLEKIYKTGNYDIVHMSLSTSDRTYRDQLGSVCRRLSKSGVLIIASQNNMANVDSFPCEFKDVIGVGGKIYESDEVFEYNPISNIQITANKVPSLTKSLVGRYRFFGGTSKAAACFTGIVASHWGEIKKNGINTFLMKECKNDNKVQITGISTNARSFVEQRWKKSFGGGVKEEAVRSFLAEFEEEYSVKIEWERFTLLDFEDLTSLSRKLSLYT